ncbi:ultraviolet-B receptor UVR8 isoform X2 [Citrus clementina]|uniref:ultraviolet-B receptor UVR8 isoform X2 n=1 Tax=Citrus clementina TaxID=85681 RepID=UPI000CED5EC7|nr:ultraviolet-B receptor UVR8 isoform X2 [Citrus x clementina]
MLGRSLTAMTKYHLKQDIKLGSKLGICKRWISSTLQRRFAALWGNGDYGRLGLGSLESRWRPVVCSAFEKHSLKALACGGAHTLFLTETGCIYATGLNDFGQLGISENIGYSLEPLRISGLKKEVVQISTGYHHSSAITEAAKVIPIPTKVECLSGIFTKQAALGFEHSVAVTGGGKVLSWGAGGSGRLGHGQESSILGFLRSTSEYTPRLIKELEGVKVKIAAAGFLHSACIDENGRVYIFGDRAVDKMLFQEGNHARRPSLISKLPYSEEVVCGGYHTCVLTSGGELYTWGSNENGCLGIGSIDVLHSPERVQGPFSESPVDQVSCGWKHTAAISEGKILTWGWGGSHGTFSEDGHSSGGQLGHGNDVDYIHPTIVNFGENVKALQVSCGFNHTGALLEYV